jgi:hypothetical protein
MPVLEQFRPEALERLKAEILHELRTKGLEAKYITVSQAQLVSNLGRSSVYNIINDPRNKIRTKCFSTKRDNPHRKVRLINYEDFLKFLDCLPEDL